MKHSLRHHFPVLGGFITMNPYKILLVLVTHIFYMKKLRHKEIH